MKNRGAVRFSRHCEASLGHRKRSYYISSMKLPDFEWDEDRFFCFGKVKGGVMTVRFTYREGIIRIIGAGYWRKGKKIYEKENHIHR